MVVQDEGVTEEIRILLRAQRAQRIVIFGTVELDMADITSENALAL